MTSWSRRGRPRAALVVPIPGASAVLAAVAAVGRGRAALDVRGVPAAHRPRAARPPGADRGRRARHGHLRGARAGGRDAARPGRGLRSGPARRGLPRADQAPRGDRPRRSLGELVGRGDTGAATCRRAASSSLVVGRRGRRRSEAADRTATRVDGSPRRAPGRAAGRRRASPGARRPARSRPRPACRAAPVRLSDG